VVSAARIVAVRETLFSVELRWGFAEFSTDMPMSGGERPS
jgi:hypothetical protein